MPNGDPERKKWALDYLEKTGKVPTSEQLDLFIRGIDRPFHTDPKVEEEIQFRANELIREEREKYLGEDRERIRREVEDSFQPYRGRTGKPGTKPGFDPSSMAESVEDLLPGYREGQRLGEVGRVFLDVGEEVTRGGERGFDWLVDKGREQETNRLKSLHADALRTVRTGEDVSQVEAFFATGPSETTAIAYVRRLKKESDLPLRERESFLSRRKAETRYLESQAGPGRGEKVAKGIHRLFAISKSSMGGYIPKPLPIGKPVSPSPYGSALAPFGQHLAPFGKALPPYGTALAPYGGQALSPFGSALHPYGSKPLTAIPNGGTRQLTMPAGKSSGLGQYMTPQGNLRSLTTPSFGRSTTPQPMSTDVFGAGLLGHRSQVATQSQVSPVGQMPSVVEQETQRIGGSEPEVEYFPQVRFANFGRPVITEGWLVSMANGTTWRFLGVNPSTNKLLSQTVGKNKDNAYKHTISATR